MCWCIYVHMYICICIICIYIYTCTNIYIHIHIAILAGSEVNEQRSSTIPTRARDIGTQHQSVTNTHATEPASKQLHGGIYGYIHTEKIPTAKSDETDCPELMETMAWASSRAHDTILIFSFTACQKRRIHVKRD